MSIVNLVLGVVVLVAGRSLYWAFVAVAGLLLGIEFSESILPTSAPWVHVMVGVGAGVAGALIAISARRIGFAIAGFFSGGYFAILAVQHAGLPGPPWVWLCIGGGIGAIAAALLMDWHLIVLSSPTLSS